MAARLAEEKRQQLQVSRFVAKLLHAEQVRKRSQ